MGIMQKTAIIIPCYNEENRLDSQAILDFTKNNPAINFVLVNDGSDDTTFDILNHLQHQNSKQIFVITLPENLGKAEAVRHGFMHAFSMPYNYIGFWDADLATPLFEINNLYTELHKSKKSIGFASRVKLLNRNIARKPFRHYLGRIFATLSSFLLQLTVYDTQCGAKLFKNTRELQAVFNTPFTVNWIFDVEIIARFILVKKITNSPPIEQDSIEYPLLEWIDVPGSKLCMFDFVKAGVELARIGTLLYAPKKEERGRTFLGRVPKT